MKRSTLVIGALIVAGTSVATGALIRYRQVRGQSAIVQTPYQNQVSIVVQGDYRVITSNGIPSHLVGAFPNRGNPNTIKPQKYQFRVPLTPKPATRQARGALFGVAINGVVFDPGTAELWNNDFRWHYEALSGLYASRGSLGMDANLAHVQPNGAYHYHGMPRGLLTELNYTTHMTLVGWAADGYPIYGPYGYVDANDPKSGLKVLKSSYRLRSGERDSSNGPGGVYDSSFASDFEYVAGLGDLDRYNGRYGVTPEFPNGTFYYVLTEDFPFVPRQLKGEADSSFRKMGPPPGGRGDFGGPPQGGPPFGGPPPNGG